MWRFGTLKFSTQRKHFILDWFFTLRPKNVLVDGQREDVSLGERLGQEAANDHAPLNGESCEQ